MTEFCVKDIKPNPFRNIDRYPYDEDKIIALRESLRSTGFWDNVVARLTPEGKPEIAYGHHRLMALREEFGPSHKVQLIIRPLSDDAMLKIMARENQQEWATNALVEMETVAAVVKAFADGRIELAPVNQKASAHHLRYAPSYILGAKPDALRVPAMHAYTAESIAKFIGWTEPKGGAQDKLYISLTALQYIEEGLLKEADFRGLSSSQARAVVEEAHKARQRREYAARVEKQAAERAAREAAAAEKARKEKEEERERQQRRAEQARSEAARKNAEARASEAAREAAREKAKRDQAEERRKEAERNAGKQREEGRKRAAAVGSSLSKDLKSGKISTKQASAHAAKMETKKNRPPPDFDKFVRSFSSDINKILSSKDGRQEKLQLIITWIEQLPLYERKELGAVLRALAERCVAAANIVWPSGNTRKEVHTNGVTERAGGLLE